MNNFQSSLCTLIVLSFLRVIQGSAQFSSSASFKPLSSALDINQTRLQGSTNPLQTSQDDLPSTTSSQPSSTSSSTCLQPRSPTDPNAAALQSSAASDDSISKACNHQIGISALSRGPIPLMHSTIPTTSILLCKICPFSVLQTVSPVVLPEAKTVATAFALHCHPAPLLRPSGVVGWKTMVSIIRVSDRVTGLINVLEMY